MQNHKQSLRKTIQYPPFLYPLQNFASSKKSDNESMGAKFNLKNIKY
jgi:hypothetical protein